MTDTLELPTGETVTPSDVFLYNDYPYRYVPLEDDEYAFKLSPLYWGGAGMDVPFGDRSALVDQWGPESSGTMSDDEWESWLANAREDERFGDDELDAVRREILNGGLLARIRDLLRV